MDCGARHSRQPGSRIYEKLGERDLGMCRLFPFGPIFEDLNELEVVRQVFRREAGLDAVNVALGEAGIFVDRASEETRAERAPRNEADAELLAQRPDAFGAFRKQIGVFCE
jgi:hypothetical protein